MSILSSTSSGIYAKINEENLNNLGYKKFKSKNSGNTIYIHNNEKTIGEYNEVIIYDDVKDIYYISVVVRRLDKIREYNRIWDIKVSSGVYDVIIENLHDLLQFEKYWSLKGDEKYEALDEAIKGKKLNKNWYD